MATYSWTAIPSNITDAAFRTWIGFINTMMITAGWVQTPDTGQINFATATAPVTPNTKVGYALYRMDDALQATYPIIVKFAFGSAAVAARPGIWFMIGTNSDGAGNLIDPNDENREAYLLDQYTQSSPAMEQISSGPDARLCFGSGDTARVVFILFEGDPTVEDADPEGGLNPQIKKNDWESEYFTMLFSIERARDWTGAYVGTHVALVWTAQTSLPNRNIYIEAQHGHVLLPPLASLSHGLGYAPGTTVAPAQVFQGASGCPLITNNRYKPEGLEIVAPATPPIHFLRNTFPAAPGINIQLSRWSRFEFLPWPPLPWPSPEPAIPSKYATGITIALSPYGTPRTYRTVAGLRAPLGLRSPYVGDPTVWVYILYE